MTSAVHLCEVGQVIIVGVGVVLESTFFDNKLSRVHAGAIATIPTQRSLSTRLLNGLNRPLHMLLFFLTTKAPLLTPAPAVRTGLVSTLAEPLPDLRITFQCNRTGKEGYLYLVLI